MPKSLEVKRREAAVRQERYNEQVFGEYRKLKTVEKRTAYYNTLSAFQRGRIDAEFGSLSNPGENTPPSASTEAAAASTEGEEKPKKLTAKQRRALAQQS